MLPIHVLVHGRWTDWTPAICTTTCGPGTITQHRTCSNPAPLHWGNVCVGDRTYHTTCYLRECPSESISPLDIFASNEVLLQKVNGQWTLWTGWTTCTVTCGGGTRTRDRACTNPAPQHGGAPCSTLPLGARHTEDCSLNPCPSRLHKLY